MTQAEHFKIVNDAYTKHRGGQMTSLELADGLNGERNVFRAALGVRELMVLSLSLLCALESHFVAPRGLGKHRLDRLPAYIHQLLPTFKKDFLGKGKRRDKSPYFLILCSSALRCVEVIK